MTPGPLTEQEAHALFIAAGLLKGQPLAVAVSGGADSLALAVAAHSFAPVKAFIVDHGLRSESAKEAAATQKRLTGLGISSEILTLDLDKKAGNLQARARRARYRSLASACQRYDLKILLLGHHRGDQAETVLMRLARGSGVKGLSAMAPRTPYGDQGLELVRPFLSTAKVRLEGLLTARGLDWIEDPSNQDPKFDRVRVRGALSGLADADQIEGRIAAAATALKRADQAIDFYVRRTLGDCVVVQEGFWLTLHPMIWQENYIPDEVRLRVLAQTCQLLTGSAYGPGADQLGRLMHLGFTGTAGDQLTVQHCLIQKGEDASVHFIPEAGRIGAQPVSGDAANRLYAGIGALEIGDADAALSDTSLCVRPLGEPGWQAVVDLMRATNHRCLSWPFAVRKALPAIFKNDQLVAAALLGYSDGKVRINLTSAPGDLSSRVDTYVLGNMS